MKNSLEIGQRLRDQREAHGYTREELAEMVDITPRFCYDIELGNKGMSIDTLSLLSKILCVSTDYILFGSNIYSKDDDTDSFISLIHSCPKSKKEHLRGIITCFLKAVH